MPRLIGIIAALLLGGSSIYAVGRFRSANTPIPAESITSQVEIKTVNALGRLEPKGEVIKLSAPASFEGNRLEKLLVKRGDRVKTGQVIGILDSRDQLAATVEESKHQVALAQANLQKVKLGAKEGEIQAQQATISRLKAERETEIQAQQATIERLEAQLANARTEYQRNQYLYQQGAISASLRDTERLEYSTIQKELAQARANLRRIRTSRQEEIREGRATLDKIAEVRPVDVAAARAEFNRSIAALEKAKANLRQAYVRSPQNGQVFEIYTRPGEIVSNDGIVEIGRNSQMYVVAEIYQSDVSKIRPGQQVKVFSDSLPGELSGTVQLVGLQVKRQDVINADPSTNIDSRIVETRVRLDQESSKKAANFTNLQVRVEIQL